MSRAAEAAGVLLERWRTRTRIDMIPSGCRPASREDAYAVQREIGRLSGFSPAGWKIAATSTAGQQHINVDGPLGGRLYAERRLSPHTPVPLTGNSMNVAEPEFAFRIGVPLPPRRTPYTTDQVVGAVASLHPAIEVPDSRFVDFTAVGGPQLIADTACACWFLIGQAGPSGWRALDLAAHRVQARRNGSAAGEGGGVNVLGDPRTALTWLANELSGLGVTLEAGEVVITGTCMAPIAVAPGDEVLMDFGSLGTITATFTA